eukprot:627565-Pyramimonas_sp.AAC.1
MASQKPGSRAEQSARPGQRPLTGAGRRLVGFSGCGGSPLPSACRSWSCLPPCALGKRVRCGCRGTCASKNYASPLH